MSYSGNHIIDTVVLLYFLLVKETDLLCTLLGRPLHVPLAVYDPEDRILPPGALRRSDLLSEMRQSIRYYEKAATSGGLPNPAAIAVGYVDTLYDHGSLVPVPMTRDDRLLAAKLQSSEVADYGLSVSLGAGEVACIAISYHRGWTITTDDNDALKALGRTHHNQGFSFERIRKLLIRAGKEGHITPQEAHRIHTDMRNHGFWDTERPFP